MIRICVFIFNFQYSTVIVLLCFYSTAALKKMFKFDCWFDAFSLVYISETQRFDAFSLVYISLTQRFDAFSLVYISLTQRFDAFSLVYISHTEIWCLFISLHIRDTDIWCLFSPRFGFFSILNGTLLFVMKYVNEDHFSTGKDEYYLRFWK